MMWCRVPAGRRTNKGPRQETNAGETMTRITQATVLNGSSDDGDGRSHARLACDSDRLNLIKFQPLKRSRVISCHQFALTRERRAHVYSRGAVVYEIQHTSTSCIHETLLDSKRGRDVGMRQSLWGISEGEEQGLTRRGCSSGRGGSRAWARRRCPSCS